MRVETKLEHTNKWSNEEIKSFWRFVCVEFETSYIDLNCLLFVLIMFILIKTNPSIFA